MNETLDNLWQHRSIRAYTDEPVSEENIDAIVRAAWRAPSSINGQQISLVVIRDAATRARIADIAGGQSWVAQAPVFITVVVDFHKTALGAKKAGEKQIIETSVEGFGVGAVDAGIALASIMTAARALGLGTVPISGIRRDPKAMVELLGLPKRTFPLVGVSIGHPAHNVPLKPRLDLSSFRHDEYYHGGSLPDVIDRYDQAMMDYWQAMGRDNGQPWSVNTASIYNHVNYPNTRSAAIDQGFGFDH